LLAGAAAGIIGLAWRSISAIRSATGSSFQALNTTGTNRGARPPALVRAASSRSRAATPARSSELLPTPLSAYRTVSGAVRRWARITFRSTVLPKNHLASSSV
jgi:hypothetical protein